MGTRMVMKVNMPKPPNACAQGRLDLLQGRRPAHFANPDNPDMTPS